MDARREPRDVDRLLGAGEDPGSGATGRPLRTLDHPSGERPLADHLRERVGRAPLVLLARHRGNARRGSHGAGRAHGGAGPSIFRWSGRTIRRCASIGAKSSCRSRSRWGAEATRPQRSLDGGPRPLGGEPAPGAEPRGPLTRGGGGDRRERQRLGPLAITLYPQHLGGRPGRCSDESRPLTGAHCRVR